MYVPPPPPHHPSFRHIPTPPSTIPISVSLPPCHCPLPPVMRRIWHNHVQTKPSKQASHLSLHHDYISSPKLAAPPFTKPIPTPPSSDTDHSLPDPVAEKARRVELIVKLGGSALTVKSRPHTFHQPRFDASIDAMARLHRLGHGFIIVHGAGSFGHFEAAHFAVSHGGASPLGVSATHAAVTHLNRAIVDALIKRGVPAVGVSPLLVPAKIRNDFVAALLDRGHLPVLHGDACYAADGRTAILSGDALVASLATSFEFVTRAVFLSDVPGVLARPPEECIHLDDETVMEKELVRRIKVNEHGVVNFESDIHTSTRTHDVTGGITSKVAAAAKCVSNSEGRVTAFIAGIGTQGAEDALTGKPERWGAVQCTRICYEVEGAPSFDEKAPSDSGSGRRRWFGHAGSGLRLSAGLDAIRRSEDRGQPFTDMG